MQKESEISESNSVRGGQITTTARMERKRERKGIHTQHMCGPYNFSAVLVVPSVPKHDFGHFWSS